MKSPTIETSSTNSVANRRHMRFGLRLELAQSLAPNEWGNQL